MNNMIKLITGGVAALLLLSLGMCSMETVENGTTGVVVSYGEATGTVEPGLHFVNPLGTKIVPISNQQIRWDSTTSAYTKDVQQADIAFTITYSLAPDKVLWTYKNIGEDWPTAIIPQVAEQSIKDVLGQSEAVKDAINNRAAIQQKIRTILTQTLARRNVIVHGFELRDISFSAAFEKAVEAKQVAVENANAARNRTVEIEERAKQRVITANAEAEAMRIQSQALSANASLVQWEAVKKWNGVLPQNMYGANAVPFIQTR